MAKGVCQFTVTDVRAVQFENAASAMLVMVLGRFSDVRPLQLENASDPILVTELGMLSDVRPEPENA